MNHRRHQILLVTAMALTGLSMRSAVGSVGAVLTDLQAGLHLSSGAAGLVTTLPVLCFAGLGSLAPALAARIGEHRLLVLALIASALGLVGRSLVGSLWPFLGLSVFALSGAAFANVLMPALVKRHFPDQIGRMSSVYITAIAIGITAASGASVPIGDIAGGWRAGIGVWAVLAAIAVLPWLPTLAADQDRSRSTARRLGPAQLGRNPLTWALTLMFAFQSFQAYVSFGWFSDYFQHEGLSAGRSGLLVAFFAALGIPVSIVIPALAQRHQLGLILAMTATGVAGYAGLLMAPVAGAWLWMLLLGITGGMFPLTLTMLGLHCRSVETTAAVSAFMQGVGYILAGSGPLLVGLLLDVTNQNWTPPLLLTMAALFVSAGAGVVAARSSYVEDTLGVSTPAARA
ncbi:MAG: transporter [Frankiales bacterium]|nr:transporter [Frankiales bacterium]